MTKAEKKGLRRFVCGALVCALTMSALCACGREPVISETEAQSRIEARVQNDANEITVMTFNVAAPWGNFFTNTLTGMTTKAAAEVIAEVLPDSFGTQEMNFVWEARFKSLLSFYDSYGVERGGDGANKLKCEKNTVFWLKSKYTAVDKGNFWLSETPEEASRYSGAGCNRVCTWVLLEDNVTGMRYLHMNTHLDHVSDEARNYGAEVIVQKLGELEEKYPGVPVVLTGDFNTAAESLPYNTLTAAGFADMYTLAQEGENVRSYQGWGAYGADEELAIDFIFAKGAQSASVCRVLSDMDTDISDHYPVMAVIDLGA